MATVQKHGCFFANNRQNVYEKQVIFKCFQKPQVQDVKTKLCLMIALFSCFFFNNFKAGKSAGFLGRIGGKIRRNLKNGHFPKT